MNVTLDLDTLLRYTLSGGVFVVCFSWLSGQSLTGSTAPSLATLIVIGLLAGALVYSLHRALIHPFLNRVIQLLLLGAKDTHYKTDAPVWSWNFAVLTRVELKALSIRRLLRRNPEDRAWYARWASQTHFIYTSTEAYWLACILVPLTGHPLPRPDLGLGIVSIVLFGIAFQDDVRGASVELETPPQV